VKRTERRGGPKIHSNGVIRTTVEIGRILFGLVVAALGLYPTLAPYNAARLGERLDAIGSRRSWVTIEPTTWNVRLTRIAGVLTVVFGLVVAVGP
jgi:hypothetical protein